MPLSPTDLASAQQIISLIQQRTELIKQKDDEPGVDQDTAAGSVSISRKGLEANGKPSIIVPVDSMYQDDLYEGQVQFDTGSGQIKKADSTFERYYVSGSYGKSASDFMHYKIEPKVQKDGFLGLTGAPHDRLVYTMKRDEYYNTNNTIDRITVDAKSGQVVAYKHKAFADTFPQALKEVCFSGSGLALLGVTAALTEIPGTLPQVLFGPWAGLVAVPAVAIALAYYKTRHW